MQLATVGNSAEQLGQDVREFSLENGLRVLLKPIPTSSAVSTWLFYGVGSRNERPGITGASHWCEHMMFKGGGRLAKGNVFKLVSREGGSNNAFTDRDITAYYETLPKSALEVALFIESERMMNSAFDPAEVENERQVIISEREGSENYPLYLLREELYASAFRSHPYRWPVVGWKSDLKTMTRNDLFDHYRAYYHPGNAVLVICGNVEQDRVVDLISSYFSKIPARDEGAPSSGTRRTRHFQEEPGQKGERTSEIVDKGSLDYLVMGFRVPRLSDADTASLMVMSAVVGGWNGLVGFFGNRFGFVPRSNRLYRRLVEGKVASEVSLQFPVNIEESLLQFEITVMPNSYLETATQALVEELEGVKDKAPSEDEMRVALSQICSWHAYENDGATAKALTMGMMEMIENRTMADTLVEKASEVSPDEVSRVAKKYLSETNRTLCTYRARKA